MEEYIVQRAWDDYKKDFGLGRLMLFIAAFNALFFFLSGLHFGEFRILALFPSIMAMAFFWFRPKLLQLPAGYLFVVTCFMLGLITGLNYTLIGQFDQMAGGLKRLDQFFVNFDLWIFGMHAAFFTERIWQALGEFQFLIYDFMIISYYSYFLLPYIGAAVYYTALKPHQYAHIGRYLISVALYFQINFLFYLIIPVTGPQYFLSGEFSRELPFSSLGLSLYQGVQNAQSTFIDCFPSGHVGISFLITVWLLRLKHPARWIFLVLSLGIIMATLSLRYHYLLDVLASIPLAISCYALSYLLVPLRSRGSLFGAVH